MPDCDEFARFPRSVKALKAMFSELHAAANGSELDEGCIRDGISRVIEDAGGVPSLAPVLELFGPQLPLSVEAYDRCDRIEAVVGATGSTALDLILSRAAQRSALAGESDPSSVVQRFLDGVVDHVVVDSTRGLVDEWNAVQAPVSVVGLHDQLRPILTRIAEELLRRPHAKRLRKIDGIRPVELGENLIGGAR